MAAILARERLDCWVFPIRLIKRLYTKLTLIDLPASICFYWDFPPNLTAVRRSVIMFLISPVYPSAEKTKDEKDVFSYRSSTTISAQGKVQ